MTNFLLSGVLMCAVIAPLGAAAQVAPGAAPAAPQVAADLPDDYVIGPDDVLSVVFWKEPELTSEVTVRPDGRITLPVIGELAAAGLRPEQLQAEILTRATKYLTVPNVQVVVRTINSRRVFVTGRVTTPGGHLLKGPLTVMQAIALAGGLTEYTDAKNITVLRTTSTGSVRFQFNYKDVARGKNLQQNIALLPGDTVVVP